MAKYVIKAPVFKDGTPIHTKDEVLDLDDERAATYVRRGWAEPHEERKAGKAATGDDAGKSDLGGKAGKAGKPAKGAAGGKADTGADAGKSDLGGKSE